MAVFWNITAVWVFVIFAAGPTRPWSIKLDFCKRPDPWPLSKIRPELFASIRNLTLDGVRIDNESVLPEYVRMLEENGLLKATRPVAFIVHGYMGYMDEFPGYASWVDDIRRALLAVEDYAVIFVDWSGGSDVLFSYGEAASNTQTVAAFLANLSSSISSSDAFQGDENLLYLYCIGHSLGAHVCGQAGRASKIFDRVTGMDPAGPGFESCSDHLHVDVDSATCVDNIHTDGTSNGHWDPFVEHYGTLEAWGHIDFYPNGGGGQPGCFINDIPPCSHARAISLFTETIQDGPSGCMAICNNKTTCGDSIQPMGYYSSCSRDQQQVVPGTFYLETAKKLPYCES